MTASLDRLRMGCTSEEDWNEATDMIRSANGGELPPFWPALIGEGGLRERLRQQWQPAQQGGSACPASPASPSPSL
jgi:hypothetical protein